MKSEPPDMEQAKPSLQCNTGPDSSAGQAESLDNGTVPRKPRKMLWAAILSLLVPGLGQVYNGQILKGLVLWFVLSAFVLISAVLRLHLTFYGWVLLLAVSTLIYLAALVEAVITARKLRVIESKAYDRWYVYVAVIVFCSISSDFLISDIVALKRYKMPAGSMERTLQIGDCFCVHLGEYGDRAPMRGEIIVFEFSEDTTKDFVKRVIAVGGDTVEIRDKKVFLNGEKLADPHAQFLSKDTLPARSSPRDNLGPLKVPDGSLFVMGDNRDFSLDSRFFGFVDIKAVKGRALFIYWADDKSRVGMSVQ